MIKKYKNLKRKAEKNNQRTKKRKDENVIFVKKVPLHPRERLVKTAKNNTKQTILLDVSRVDEETIVDKIIENLPSTNDGFYIIHEPRTNSFSLRHEDGK